jgi:sucrose phosphorylase
MKNKVQLIVYAERFGGSTLNHLASVLQNTLSGVFGAVHLLPFYESIHGTDAGFDPVNHMQVDHTLGAWPDVAALSAKLDVMADVIVNHVSNCSPEFLDFSKHGKHSRYAGLFLTQETVFPHGLSAADKALIYRPRPTSAFTEVTLACGEQHALWTTFTSSQIDIDVSHPQGRAYLLGILDRLASNGVHLVRLDAVGYAVKKAGTSCFMLPETFAFIDDLSAEAKARGIEVLVEVHSHYQTQIDIARRVDWVYDFALPPLLLHALYTGSATALKTWLAIRPTNAVTVLDTHDGIGIIDIGADKKSKRPGLVSDAELDALVERIHLESQGQSRMATGAAASNLDLYQVNCTYFDALGRDAQKYLIARAVQFFTPGVPQVYYVGLLAGENDMALLEKTKVGRDINRHYFGADELAQDLQKPVVQALLDLIKLRNSHPAFAGQLSVSQSSEHTLAMQWEAEHDHALLEVDFAACRASLTYSSAQGLQSFQAFH